MNVRFEPCPPLIELVLQSPYRSALPGQDVFSNQEPSPEGSDTRALSAMQPHKQYTLRLNDLDQVRPLDKAYSMGWRSLEWSPGGQLGARLIGTRPNSSWEDLPRSVVFNLGPFVQRSLDGFLAAERLDWNAEYLYRFLWLPQIYIAAVWLRKGRGDGPDDLLFPLGQPVTPPDGPQSSESPEPLVSYEQEEFFGRLKDRAYRDRNNAPPSKSNSGNDEWREEGEGAPPARV